MLQKVLIVPEIIHFQHALRYFKGGNVSSGCSHFALSGRKLFHKTNPLECPKQEICDFMNFITGEISVSWSMWLQRLIKVLYAN